MLHFTRPTAFVAALIIAPLCGPANANTVCGTSSKAGDLCVCKVLELRLTQFAVGMVEVKNKETQLASKSGPTLSAYQRQHPEPTVKGPGGALFITDHHHLALARADLGIDTTFCQLEADYSGLDPDSFWTKMAGQRWLYLYDESGNGPRSPADLPRTVEGLKDDPYRSLASAVRHSGGFAKVSTPLPSSSGLTIFALPGSPRPTSKTTARNPSKKVRESRGSMRPVPCQDTKARIHAGNSSLRSGPDIRSHRGAA